MINLPPSVADMSLRFEVYDSYEVPNPKPELLTSTSIPWADLMTYGSCIKSSALGPQVRLSVSKSGVRLPHVPSTGGFRIMRLGVDIFTCRKQVPNPMLDTPVH